MERQISTVAMRCYRVVISLFILVFLVYTGGIPSRIVPMAVALVLFLSVGMLFVRRAGLLTLPFLHLCLILIFCYNSYDLFIRYLWLLPVAVVCALIHLIRLRPRFLFGPSLLPLCAVALACALGGIGRLPAAAYLSPLSLYYIAGLGVGMVLVYLLMRNEIRSKEDVAALQEDLAFLALTAAGVVLCFTVMFATLERPNFRFQWKNNIATMMMLGLPALAAWAKQRPVLLAWSAGVWMALIFTFSRGAWIFGTLEMLLCLVWLIGTETQRRVRRIYGGVTIAFAALIVFGAVFLLWRNGSGFLSEDVRVTLLVQGLRDFCDSPLTGQGLGNSLNMEIRRNLQGSLYWYHLFPVQIIGSMGILGAFAWGWQLVVRARLAWQLRREAVFCLPLCYAGLLLMSMVNPGEFCPLPYGMLAVMIFAACEEQLGIQKTLFFKHRAKDGAPPETTGVS